MSSILFCCVEGNILADLEMVTGSGMTSFWNCAKLEYLLVFQQPFIKHLASIDNIVEYRYSRAKQRNWYLWEGPLKGSWLFQT